MSARSIANSARAAASAPPSTLNEVKEIVVRILADLGPLTDDGIYDEYEASARRLGRAPRVTPQRVRSARAELVRDGRVVADLTPGWSRYGNRATLWDVPSLEQGAVAA